jgi:hypothetical protein
MTAMLWLIVLGAVVFALLWTFRGNGKSGVRSAPAAAQSPPAASDAPTEAPGGRGIVTDVNALRPSEESQTTNRSRVEDRAT